MKLKHYLIAGPDNNYQPWILSKTALVCFCLSIWWLRLFMPGYIDISNGQSGLDATDLMARINTERTNRFLPPLVTNSKLNAAASIKSQDMIDRDYFAHINPDGDYIWPTIEEQGYKPYQALGENLAIDFTTPQALVNAWMNSPGHRANIINDKFEDQGLAATLGQYENRESYLVTNLFGSLFKVSAQPEPTPTPLATTQTSAPTPAVQNSQQLAQEPQPTPTSSNMVTTEASTNSDSSNSNTSAPSSTSNQTTDEPTPVKPTPKANQTDGIATKSNNLTSLKITVGILAGLYAIFLVIDSIIIHRTRIQRPGSASSPHALAMLLIAVANFITLWL